MPRRLNSSSTGGISDKINHGFGRRLTGSGQAVNGILSQEYPASAETETATLTVAEIIGGWLIGTPGSPASYTTPTAVAIYAALTQVQTDVSNAAVRQGFDFTIRNEGTQTITLVGGTGVTLATGNTNTVATLHTRTFRFIFTTATASGAAITVYALQDSAH